MEEAHFNAISSTKLTAERWKLVEKPLTEIEIKSNTILYNYGLQTGCETTTTIKSKLTTVGEYYYNVIREQIKDFITLPITNYKHEEFEKTFNKNKKNKIILENCKKTLTNQMAVFLKTLNDSPHEKIYEDLMNGYDCIEFRIIILMKIIQFHSKTNKYNTNENLPAKEELLIASKKILHILKKIKTMDENYFIPLFTIPTINICMCNQLIDDLTYKIEVMTNDFNVKLYDIANKRPKLIYNTKYDCTISELKIKLHDTQIDCINTLKNNYNFGSLIIYKTLTGLGKTSTVLALASFIMKQHELNNSHVMLFCCSDTLDAVRIQVLRLIHNFQLKFGVCTVNEDDETKYVLKKSFICGKHEPVFLVCDYISTYLLLKESHDGVSKKNYTLFFDEPTVLTDNSSENNKTLDMLVKILYYIPKNTVLSSATFPQMDEFQTIINHYSSKYNQSIVREIKSNKTLIGCIIKDFDNNTITPHVHCKTPNELGEFINKIKCYPLLGKFYTLPFLINLNEFLKKYNLNGDLDSIETFEHESIVENVLVLLQKVSEHLNGTDYDEFLKIKIIDINDTLSVNLSKVDENYGKICPDKFISQHAFKYFGCCWIASEHPETYVTTNFTNTLDKIKEKMLGNNSIKCEKERIIRDKRAEGITITASEINIKGNTIYHSINDCYEKYNEAKKTYNHAIADIIVKSETVTTNKKTKCLTENRTKGYDAFENNIQKVEEPRFEFPKILQVNTSEHIKAFAKYVEMYDSSMLKIVINPEKYDITKFEVSDDIKFLLFMGIAIYSKNICQKYAVAVLDLLQNRQLAFIIAGKEFCYGANYQLSCLILCDEIMDLHSTDTILQSIGRTSRIGKSESGRVYLDRNTARRITDFFANPQHRSIEGHNISTWFNRFKQSLEKPEPVIVPEMVVAKQTPVKILEINGVEKRINVVNKSDEGHHRPRQQHFLQNSSNRNERVERTSNSLNLDIWTRTPTTVVAQRVASLTPHVEQKNFDRGVTSESRKVIESNYPKREQPITKPIPVENDLEKIWGKKPTIVAKPIVPVIKPIEVKEVPKIQLSKFDVNPFAKPHSSRNHNGNNAGKPK